MRRDLAADAFVLPAALVDFAQDLRGQGALHMGDQAAEGGGAVLSFGGTGFQQAIEFLVATEEALKQAHTSPGV